MIGLVKYGHGVGLLELRQLEVPKIEPNEVLIEVKGASICGSDIHIYRDEHPYWPPMVLGHEFSGQIVEVGEKVERWKAGDRVVSETRTATCGVCRQCQTGYPQLCPDKRPPGIGRDGAFTKFIAMPASLLHRLPDNVSFDAGAVCEPLAICTTALIETAKIRAGERVVIIGPGPIGQLSMQIALAAGASKVVVCGRAGTDTLRLAKATELGATRVVKVDEENVEEAVMEETGGEGADIVVECSGAAPAIAQSFGLARRRGRVAAIGISGRNDVPVPWDDAIFKAQQLLFCFSSSWSAWGTALSLLEAGRLNVEALITHRIKLEQWEGAFRDIEEGRAIKVIIHP